MDVDGVLNQLEKVIRGKRAVLEELLICAIAGGHVLIEDLPGMGKTTLAKAFHQTLNDPDEPLTFRRIQFTPDLLPTDITGVDVFDPGHRGFRFQPGPVFAHVVLADELNRGTPKVQSALLEVMAERQVTVGGRRYPLDEFFLVIATENPVDHEGVYVLPLAQVDRFMMRVSLGYPGRDAELSILQDDPSERLLPELTAVARRGDLLAAREAARETYVSEELKVAVVEAAQATREDRRIRYGVSPRAVLMLLHAAQARAYVYGRDFVIPEDVLELLEPVWLHRIRLRDDGADARAVLRDLSAGPVEALYDEVMSRG